MCCDSRKPGFSLVEALLAVALLAVALLPAMAAFRSQAAGVERLARRQAVHRAMTAAAAAAETALRHGTGLAASSGFAAPGIWIEQTEAQRRQAGRAVLWHFAVTGRDAKAGYAQSFERWLLLPAAKEVRP